MRITSICRNSFFFVTTYMYSFHLFSILIRIAISIANYSIKIYFRFFLKQSWMVWPCFFLR